MIQASEISLEKFQSIVIKAKCTEYKSGKLLSEIFPFSKNFEFSLHKVDVVDWIVLKFRWENTSKNETREIIWYMRLSDYLEDTRRVLIEKVTQYEASTLDYPE